MEEGIKNNIITYTTENYKNDQYFGHSEQETIDGIVLWECEYTDNGSYSHKE